MWYNCIEGNDIMNIELRKAIIQDAERLIDINIAVWWSTYKGLIPDEIIEKLQIKNEQRIENKKKDILEKQNTYVAIVNGQIVGYSSYGKSRDANYPQSCEIYSCYILEEYQGFHIGRMLATKILQEFVNSGYTTMITKCLVGNPSNKFHEAIGGNRIGITTLNLMGYNFEENTFYHPNINESLKLNQDKLTKINNINRL